MITAGLIAGIALIIVGTVVFWSPKQLTSHPHFWKMFFHKNISRVPRWKKHLMTKGTGGMILAFGVLVIFTAAYLQP